MPRTRERIVIPNVLPGGATGLMLTPVLGRPILVQRVRVTIDPAVDPEAVTGAGATDIAAEVRENASVAAGVGNTAGAVPFPGVPLVYSLTPLLPSLSIDSPEPAIGVFPPSTEKPAIVVYTNAGAAASTAVVTIEYDQP